MFICIKLIEETGRHPELIFACRNILGLARTSSSLRNFFAYLTKLWGNCHIFGSVKNHINANISHPIRDRTVKLNTICIFILGIRLTPEISNILTHHRIIKSSWCYKIFKKIQIKSKKSNSFRILEARSARDTLWSDLASVASSFFNQFCTYKHIYTVDSA